jgi:hypothetical protein
MGGLLGGQSVLFAKSTAELIKSLFHGGDCFAHLETYCIIAALAVCLTLQMHFLNGGLVNYDALAVVPIYQVIMNKIDSQSLSLYIYIFICIYSYFFIKYLVSVSHAAT